MISFCRCLAKGGGVFFISLVQYSGLIGEYLQGDVSGGSGWRLLVSRVIVFCKSGVISCGSSRCVSHLGY